MIYRWFWALWHLSWLIYTFIDETNMAYYFIMLTNLTYCLLTILNIYWAIFVTYHWYQHKRKDVVLKSRLTVSFKILWVIQEAAYLSSLVVTSAYWAAVYNPGNIRLILLFLLVYILQFFIE